MSNKRFLLIGGAIIAGLIGLMFICCIFLVLLSPPRPRDQTLEVESAPAGQEPTTVRPGTALTYEGISKNAQQLTELKRNEYYQTLVGKNVHWSGKVADVTSDGDVRIRILSAFAYDVVLTGVPKPTSANLNLKDTIEFDGTIIKVDDLFGSGHPIITLKFVGLKKP